MWSSGGTTRAQRREQRRAVDREAEAEDRSFSERGEWVGVIKRPTMISSDGYLWGEDYNGAEAWRLNQYGLILQEMGEDANGIEVRRGGPEGLQIMNFITANTGTYVQTNLDITGETLMAGFQTWLTLLAENSSILDANRSGAQIDLVGIHNGAPLFRIALQRGGGYGVLYKVIEATYDAGLKIGVFGATPTARPTVTGSRGGNAALASLLDALEALGWVVDATTA